MAATDRSRWQQENERIAELLRKGLTTEQVHQRTGVHKRRILRIKAKIQQPA